MSTPDSNHESSILQNIHDRVTMSEMFPTGAWVGEKGHPCSCSSAHTHIRLQIIPFPSFSTSRGSQICANAFAFSAQAGQSPLQQRAVRFVAPTSKTPLQGLKYFPVWHEGNCKRKLAAVDSQRHCRR